MLKRLISLMALSLVICLPGSSQDAKQEDQPYGIPFFYGFYGYQWPGGDLSERFGSNSVIGPGFAYKSSKNWIFELEYDFLFGRNIDDGFSILENLMTSNGSIINGDGVPAVVALYERGWMVTARFGKLIPVLGPNNNSGLFITAGLGYLQHKIRIEVQNESAPQLKGDYKRGYDRLCGGFALSQSVGYLYFGERRLVNFYFALEFYEGWTENYRQYYFDTMTSGGEKRFDFLVGPKFGWIIPLRKRMSREFYYY